MIRASLASLIVIALPIMAVSAQSADKTDLDAIAACSRIADAAERLACFDAAVAGADDRVGPSPTPDSVAPQIASAPAPEPAPAPSPSPAAVDTAPDWAKAPAPEVRSESVAAREARTPNEFGILIVKVTRTGAGKLRFYTDNGQVWEQLFDNEDWDLPDTLPAEAKIKRRMIGKPVIQFPHRNRTYKVRRLQ